MNCLLADDSHEISKFILHQKELFFKCYLVQILDGATNQTFSPCDSVVEMMVLIDINIKYHDIALQIGLDIDINLNIHIKASSHLFTLGNR